MSPLSSSLFFLELLVCFGGLGLCLVPHASPGTWADALGSRFALGLSLSALLSTLGYLCGLSAVHLCVLLCTLSLAGWVRWFLADGARHLSQRLAGERGGLAALAAAMLLLVTPALVGGLQFGIFRGNHLDGYNYLESAATYSRFGYGQLAAMAPLELETQGGFPYALANLGIRPSVAILYASLSWLQPGGLVGNHHVFLLALLFCGLCTGARLVRCLSGGTNAVAALVFSTAVFCGFWGQYALDIDAWSQVACYAPLLYVSGVCLVPGFERPENTWRGWLCAAGLVYLYPEAALLLFPTLLASHVVARLMERRLAGVSPLAPLCFLLVLVPVWKSHLLLLAGQYAQATGSHDWWRYFQAFMGGMDGFGAGWFDALADACMGAYGLCFLTPLSGVAPGVALLQRGMGCLVIVAACYRALATWRTVGLPPASKASLAAFVLSLLAGLGYLYLKGQYWTAGKGLSIFAPLILLLVFSPATGAVAPPPEALPSRSARLACLLLLSWHLLLAGLRIPAAASPDGLHYPPPYPAAISPVIKQCFAYGDRSFLEVLRPGDRVAVDIEDPWTGSYVRLQLLSHGILSWTAGEVRVKAGAAERLGRASPPLPADWRITEQEEDGRIRLVVTRSRAVTP